MLEPCIWVSFPTPVQTGRLNASNESFNHKKGQQKKGRKIKHPWKLTNDIGKSPFSIGNISSNGGDFPASHVGINVQSATLPETDGWKTIHCFWGPAYFQGLSGMVWSWLIIRIPVCIPVFFLIPLPQQLQPVLATIPTHYILDASNQVQFVFWPVNWGAAPFDIPTSTIS